MERHLWQRIAYQGYQGLQISAQNFILAFIPQ
jgi:hypothetical protein